MKRFFAATTFVVAVGLLLAISARAAVAHHVEINNVSGLGARAKLVVAQVEAGTR